jgi:hypothetical protein
MILLSLERKPSQEEEQQQEEEGSAAEALHSLSKFLSKEKQQHRYYLQLVLLFEVGKSSTKESYTD